ncbi:helix-turn-helix domain-containing protein [Bradyrhizobium arachidis]|uniref:helix-turn-helix domain-containing protein n=1 Tax=Bradyrhizobium arachidis TaxID=858423 RepID=UPI002163E18F|nr:helix-turn-helix transcriptional regulator [Bradyrhizobium arachidis]UVO28161.1 helix-turn-helix domain-containing protein [Bradyrhizobium arachidis]
MPDTFNEELGRQIRAARKGKLTQEGLGSLVGLSRTAITNIECGRQRLLVDQLVEIASALGVSASSLLPEGPKLLAVQKTEAAMAEMPTVRQFITSVKKHSARSAT